MDLTVLLSEHGVKVTSNRVLVARALSRCHRPLSLSELENLLLTVDKSSISRVLTLFRAHHLVHVIDDGSGSVRYELCLSHDHDNDDDVHAHFHCELCGRTFCLDHVPIPFLSLPDGYVAHSVSYMVSGVCPDCKKR